MVKNRNTFDGMQFITIITLFLMSLIGIYTASLLVENNVFGALLSDEKSLILISIAILITVVSFGYINSYR